MSHNGMPRDAGAEQLRTFLITRLCPPLAGCPLGDWWRLMRANRFDVDPIFWPRALLNVVCSLLTSVMRRREERRYGRAIDAATILPPLFVLGHHRSGTTWLHNLLAVDRRFASPNMFQTYNPYTFRVFEPVGGRLAAASVPRRRVVDNMAWGSDFPFEDELALCMMTGCSFLMGFIFSRRAEQFERYLTFRDVSEAEVCRWQAAFVWYLKKLTWALGKPLLLKSPPHMARIRLLLEMFPDARFVHIHRDPYQVFQSCRHLHERVTAMVGLQRPVRQLFDERILRQYEMMFDAYFEERPLIPAGRSCDVRFADLERDPMEQIERIYEQLNLADFEQIRPSLQQYVDSLRSYSKNAYPPLPGGQRRTVARAWRRCFEELGYPM